MAIFRSFNDIVISFIDYLRLVQPELDTKPGTVSRDLFIDAQSQQIADLYTQLRNISGLQSLFSTSGSDLTKLASNYGVSKKQGEYSSGAAVLTMNSLDSDLLVPAGSILVSNNGISFKVVNNTLISVANVNVYKATASRLREGLSLASITDQYAVEVTVESMTPGKSGNIGPYSLRSHNIEGISNVTNLETFTDGTNPENDDAFRTRILSVFAGSNTGTSLGYTNAVESISGVQDSIIVVPGDPLLIRDGTQVVTDSNGNLVVSTSGSGGKIDIYLLGTKTTSQVDSFIYNDVSGKNDPTDSSNDFILGQREQDQVVNSAQRRVELISSDMLPYQPTQTIATVAGSSSGANFVEKYTDSSGNIKGNYELVKDSGDFGGSSFGFDKLRWASDKIELDAEEVAKGTFNGSDDLDFTDIDEIRSVVQEIFVLNENPTVVISNRSNILLKHTPIKNVSRVVNLTTGERYVVEDQNPDGLSGELNATGNVTISGNTLPVSSDVLQVDYIWKKYFDSAYDFDNLKDYYEFRTAQDSIDWGTGNLVENESSVVADDGLGNISITVTHPIYKVLAAKSYSSESSTVDSGTITLASQIDNIVNIKRVSDGAELYNTDARDGTVSGTTTIILPSDTLGENNDAVTVQYNYVELYSPDGYDGTGTFSDNIINLISGTSSNGTVVLVSYIANISTLVQENNISSLPALARDNKIYIGETEAGDQPTSNVLDVDDNITANLRRAPTNLRFSLSSITNTGSLAILGETMHLVKDALVVVTPGTGYEVDLSSSIMSDLGTSTIPSSIKIAKIYKVERVNVNNAGNITSIDNTYDIVNYKLYDNSYDLKICLEGSSLTSTRFSLPETANNTESLLVTGDVLRVTFYYINTNNSEILYFSKNGDQITEKSFIKISKTYINHGFKNASGETRGVFAIKNMNQPVSNTIYNVDYNYIAPKENERITITYNYNSLINEAVNIIEDVRPITADVLIKAAKEKRIDASIKIVLLSEYIAQEQTVLQDATDTIISLLSASSLGTTVDSSDIIDALYSVRGVDRVRILNFSHESDGNVLSITAQNNEYLSAGTITVESEER